MNHKFGRIWKWQWPILINYNYNIGGGGKRIGIETSGATIETGTS
jgi:hypothetical protein